VDFMCDQTTNTTGQIKAGKVKAYAVTSTTRVPSLPDLPTLDEHDSAAAESARQSPALPQRDQDAKELTA